MGLVVDWHSGGSVGIRAYTCRRRAHKAAVEGKGIMVRYETNDCLSHMCVCVCDDSCNTFFVRNISDMR